jgi:hypothetical protein
MRDSFLKFAQAFVPRGFELARRVALLAQGNAGTGVWTFLAERRPGDRVDHRSMGPIFLEGRLSINDLTLQGEADNPVCQPGPNDTTADRIVCPYPWSGRAALARRRSRGQFLNGTTGQANGKITRHDVFR